MKKSVKILTLVLSLALLCGALVVAAFAEGDTEITGIRLDVSADMEETLVTEIPFVTSGNTENPIDKDAGAANSLNFKHQVGGIPVFAASSDGTNHYVTVNWGTETSSSGHFLHSYIKNSWGVYEPSKSAEYLDDFKYFVYDFDISFFDVENYSSNGFLLPYVTRAKQGDYDATTQTYKPSRNDIGAANFQVDFLKDGGLVYASLVGNKEDRAVIGDGFAWHHVTYILGTETITDANGENIRANIYLAVDGKIVATKTWENDLTVDASYNGDRTLIGIMGVRLDPFGRKGASGNVDNVVARTLTKDYNGNLAEVLAAGTDLTAWESNIYDAAKMPFGVAIAKNGETPYDSLQKAIAAAEDGDTITLCGNVGAQVTVDKPITIECGEYTMVPPATADGYVWNLNGTAYEITETQEALDIFWESCTCPLCVAAGEADETHPGGVDAAGYLNNTLSSYYEKAGKSTAWSVKDGNKIYTLTGWMDEDNDKLYALDAVIDEEMLEYGFITLVPYIETQVTAFSYTTNNGVASTNSLADAIAGVNGGGTITLDSDAKYAGAAIDVSKKITIDLNGYTLQAVSNTTESSSKPYLFNVKADMTIKGEKEGSALVHFYANKDNVNDDASVDTGASFGGNPTFGMKTSNLTVTFEGAGLYVNSAQLIRSDANGCTFNFNGGTYARDKVSDGYGYVYLGSGKQNHTVNVKNATITANQFFSSYDTATGNTVNVENSKLLPTNFFNKSNANAALTIKNSYIACNCAGAGATVVLDEGCLIRDPSWINDTVSYATGVVAETASEKVKFTYLASQPAVDKVGSDYKVLASTYETFNAEAEWTFVKKTIKAITVTFKDGETVLGNAAGQPGDKVVGPAAGAAEPVADGWVMAAKAYAYTIPADATADITVDIKDAESDYTYTAGQPLMYMNFTLSANLSVNLYVKKTLPEGVTNMKVTNAEGNTRTFNKTGVIGGEDYICSTAAWLTATGGDAQKQAWMTMSFEYAGQTLTYKYEHINVTDYAKAVIETYATDAKKVQQATALLQFVDAANKVAGSTTDAYLTNYLDTITKLETTVPTVENAGAMLGNLAPAYVNGVTVAIWGNNAGIGFKLTDNAKTALDNEEISIKVTADGATVSTSVSGNVVYTNNNANLVTIGSKTLTVEILDADGNVVASGSYSLAAYYTDMAATLTDDEKYLVESLYALAAIGNTNK